MVRVSCNHHRVEVSVGALLLGSCCYHDGVETRVSDGICGQGCLMRVETRVIVF